MHGHSKSYNYIHFFLKNKGDLVSNLFFCSLLSNQERRLIPAYLHWDSIEKNVFNDYISKNILTAKTFSSKSTDMIKCALFYQKYDNTNSIQIDNLIYISCCIWQSMKDNRP